MKLRLIAALVMALGTAGIEAYAELPAAHAAQAPASQVRGVEPGRQAGLPNFAAIAAQNGPAVVNISVTGTRKTSWSNEPDENDSGGGPNPGGPPFKFRDPRAQMPMRGEGSGFIVSSDGMILTNAHVVRDASDVTVKLTDRREFRAKVLGIDPATDVAVLRVEARNLPVVRLGDPAQSQVGDWVLAIGSPFGFENSVTAGIVSAKGRSLPGESYVPFIQTDAAVNPGNSGGPLFNMAGEVIGINSQIVSHTGGFQGLSFAIPIDVAVKVKDQIIATGHATHARLGVTIQEVNQTLADSFGLKKAEGALVSSVQADGAAARAGLQPGDVIVKYQGQPIVASLDLPILVGEGSPGETALLEVWRKGATREINVTLGAPDDGGKKSASTQIGAPDRLGLSVRPLTPDENREANVPAGVLVEGVEGPAERAGVQPGDIILSLNGAPLKSVAELRSLADRASKSVALLVQRGEARVFIPIRLG